MSKTLWNIFIYCPFKTTLGFLVFAIIPASLNGQVPITLFQSLAGRYDYVITGASHRTQPNTVNACSVTAGPVSATLPTIPAGSNIVAAYLYWTGSYSTAAGSTQTTPDYSVTLNGVPVTAPPSGQYTGVFVFGGTNYNFFGARADVTSLVNSATSSYAVNGLSVNSGSPHCAVTAVVAGWALLVVFENPSERIRVVNIFDGLQFYHQNLPPLTLNPTNFRVDANPDGKITAITWEGEPTIGTGENVTFRSQSAASATTLFHSGVNPVGNQFNSTITSSVSPFGVLNPTPPPQHGLDLDTYDVSSLLIEDDLSATTVYRSGGDLVILTAQVVSIANKPVSDLTIAKTDSGISFGRGECGNYTVTVFNNGPDNEFGPVIVTDTLPTGLTFNSGSGTGWSFSAAGQNVTATYTGAPIPPSGNASFTLTTQVLSTAPGSVTNSASVSGSSFDNIPGNNSTTEATSIVPGSDFSTSTKMVVDQNGGDTHNGDVLQYTITINESAGVAATGVDVTEDIPSFVDSFTVVSIPTGATDNSTGTGTGANGTGFLNVANISVPANGSVTIVFDVTVTGSHGDVISNTASINKNCPLATPSAPDITIMVPDISTATKTVVDQNGGDAHNNDVLRYTLTLTEIKGAQAQGVSVTDDIPSFVNNFTVVSIPVGVTDNSTGTGTGANGTGFLDISNITVPANGSVTIEFDVTVNGAHGDVISNTAAITNPNGPGANPSASNITIMVPDLSTSTKTVVDQNGGNVNPGDILRYTITLVESAGADVSGVSVTDDIPNFVNTFTVVTIPSGATDNSTGTGTGANGTGFLDVSGITVLANGSVTIVFDVTVAGNNGDIIANTATITNPNGPGATPNAPDLTITAASQSDLSTSTKTVVDVNGGDTNPGDTLQYTLSITESGGVAATGVNVTDDIPSFVNNFTVTTIPPGATDNSTGSGTGANGNGFLNITDMTVPANSTVTIIFTVAANGTTGDTISNTAVVVNPSGTSAVVAAPDVVISQTQKPGGIPTPITLFRSFAGNTNYVITGASHRTQPNTINSCSTTAGPVSASIPSLPAGSNILAAYLYWAGSCSDAPGSTQTAPVYTLTFNGVPVTAPASGRFTARFSVGTTNLDYFGGRADVTSLVNTITTTYTVNGLAVNTGPPHCNATAVVAGWSLLVIYENSFTERRRVVNLFDGFQFYQQTLPPLTLTPTNFQVDTNPDGKITAITWEGDPNLSGGGETVTFQSQSAGSPTTLFHSGTNPINNQFNSTITSSLAPFGSLNSTPPPQHGLDIDTYDLSSLLIEDDLSATTVYRSGQDLVIQSAQVVSIANKAVADLAINKSDNGIEFGRGECGNYVITITNNGPDAEPGPITVTDTLPTGLTFNSGSGTDWNFSAVGQTVTAIYTGAPVPVGSTTSFTLTSNVLPSAGGIVVNSVAVNGSAFDHISGNDSDTDTTNVVDGSDFSTSTKAVVDLNGGDPNPGDVLRYTITVNESAGVAATGVDVTDDIPNFVSNFTVISIPSGANDDSTGSGTGANSTGFLDIDNISVPASGSVTIEFEVTVSGSHGNVISNIASINKNCPLATPSAPDLTIIAPDLSTSTKGVVDLNGGDADPGDILQYTITIMETNGAPAPGVSVTDDIPAFVTNFTVTSIPTGATDNSTGAGTGANGNGFLDVTDITVPSSGSVTIIFEVTVAGTVGNVISNLATITNPNGPGASPSAPDVTISESQTGGPWPKELYLYDQNTADPNGYNTGPRPYISRTPPTAPQSQVFIDKNQPPVTWTLTPATQAPLIFGNGPIIPVTLWVSKNGNGGNPVVRRLTLTLDSIGTTTTTIGTLVNQSFSAPRRSTPAEVTFNIPVTSPPVTLAAGSQIRLTLQNTTPGGGNRRIRVFPIGTSSHSRVELDANTIINVDTVEFFDTAYPGGTGLTSVSPGTALFVRAVVSDPFGSFDITSASIDIIDPNSTAQVSGSNMTEVADSLVATKTYEFPYTLPTAGPIGFWTANITADEGSEGTVDDTGSGVVEVVSPMPDLVLMKTSMVNYDPYNLSTNPKRIPGAYIHYTIRLTNTGSGTVDNNTVVITDQIPANAELYVDDLGGTPATSPVLFVDGPGAQSSGLTLVFSGLSTLGDGVDFSNDPGPIFTYNYDPTPNIDADGFDSNVTSIRVNPSGIFLGAGGGNNPYFEIILRTRIR